MLDPSIKVIWEGMTTTRYRRGIKLIRWRSMLDPEIPNTSIKQKQGTGSWILSNRKKEPDPGFYQIEARNWILDSIKQKQGTGSYQIEAWNRILDSIKKKQGTGSWILSNRSKEPDPGFYQIEARNWILDSKFEKGIIPSPS